MHTLWMVFVCLIVSSSTNAQVFRQQKLQFDAYKLELPNEWKGRGRFTSIITDILDTLIPELKNKKVCVDCNAAYKVKLVVNNPSISTQNIKEQSSNINSKDKIFECTTIFSFTSGFALYAKDGHLIVELLLVEPENQFTITREFKLARDAYTTPVSNKALGNRRQSTVLFDTPSPYEYVKNNLEAMLPTQKELLQFTEQKIYEVKKIVAKPSNN